MKKLFKLLFALLLGSPVYAQHVYQIRADSVRIYNVCDTAELIIENRTRGVNGFLYNKGNGRTEFRRLQLESIGGSQIAISGQDTLDISTLPGIGGIDTVYRSGDNIVYVKKGIPYTVFAPLSTNETLQSVTSRGASTTHNIQFNSASGNPSNGLLWSYNTDSWKIFAESAQDTPAGNLIFESTDNGTEGWIFRSNAPNEQGVMDVLSLGRDKFNYKGGAVWHAGNHTPGSAFSPVLTGANVPAGFSSNASGHVTGFTTRVLTASDIGAVPEVPVAYAWNTYFGNTAGRFVAVATNAPVTGTHYGLHIPGDGLNGAQVALKSGAMYYRTQHEGAISPWFQLASQNWANSTFAPIGGSGNYIQNQFSTPQIGNLWVSGIARANNRFDVAKDGSNTYTPASSPHVLFQNNAGNRGVGFQLSGDTNPGLATWIHNGSTWVKRQEYFANGSVTFDGVLRLNGGESTLNLFRNLATGGVATGGVQFSALNASSAAVPYAQMWGVILGNTAGVENGALDFNTRQAGQLTNKMRINHLGNVMIGSTNDNGQKLQVNGGAFVSGTMYSNAAEGIRLINNGSYIAFYNTGNTARSGFVQISADAATRIYTDVPQPIQIIPGGGNPGATFNTDKSLTLGSIPASGTTASSFLTHVSGNIQSRTPAQVLSDIGAAPLSGSSNYISNSFSAAQTANAWISGVFRSNNQFENNSAPATGGYHLRNASGALRWIIRGGTNETGSGNIGYDFIINRRADDGSPLPDALTIYRSTGAVYIPGTLRMANGSFTVGTGTTTNQSFIQFMQSDQVTRDGYVGNAGGTGRNISLLSDNGSLNISAASGTNNINLNAGGYINLSNGSKNTLIYSTGGVNPPAMTTRSAGTKVVLYPSLSTTALDYGMGMETANIWNAVPQNSTTYGFKWYGGTTEVARLDGVGNFDMRGLLAIGTAGSERMSFRHSALAFNRNVNNGAIYTNTGHAYQFTHTASTTAASDFLDLQVYNPSGAGVAVKALSVNGAGNVSMSGALTVTGQVHAASFYQTSLRSLKYDIRPFAVSALSILKEAQVRTFRFKADTTGKVNVGFIADEVPEEISIPGRTGVDQASTVALLVRSVQELEAQNQLLGRQNQELEQKVKQLEAVVEKILQDKK
ncbi:tail fiber domain-containing protein [Chitinophaga sp. XS-30]|uniref:tail fiber domain-containing protein n=1 Tax=Chitinophaga sp. XS-30 TaxID=2604421 RepID=UPI001AEF4EC4|nr:tail fiber domain-containing protein [Chitinophaga sp. XS-30]